MKKRKIQNVICLIIFFLFANQASAANWIFYSSSTIGKEYYDKSSIKVDKDIISVWIKIILNEDAKTKNFLALRSIGKAPKSPDMLNHQLIMVQIDCVNSKVKSSNMTIYDGKGAVITTEPKSFISAWNNIPSDSNAEVLKGIVCGTGKTIKIKNK